MRKQKKRKNEKTEVVQEKWRKKMKSWKLLKVQQVIDGGGVQLGTSEGPRRCQPSPLRKKIKVMSIYVCQLTRTYVRTYDTCS